MQFLYVSQFGILRFKAAIPFKKKLNFFYLHRKFFLFEWSLFIYLVLFCSCILQETLEFCLFML